MRVRSKFLLGLIALVLGLTTGCSGPVWPSRAMSISISQSGPQKDEVVRVLSEALRARGFAQLDKDGRDAIVGGIKHIAFEGPNQLFVSVGLDALDEVPIRISQNRKTWTPVAESIFLEVANQLELQWPGRVSREELSRSAERADQ